MNKPPIEAIREVIRQVQRRCYLNHCLQHLAIFILVGLTMTSLVFILNHWVWLPLWSLVISLITLSCLTPLLTVRPNTSTDIAHQIDQKLGLKSRVSSAWQYRFNTDATAIAQRQDTADNLTDPLAAFPYQVPKLTILFVLPILMILASLFLPYSYRRPTAVEKLAIQSARDRLTQIDNVYLQADIDQTHKEISRSRMTSMQVEESLGELQQKIQQQNEISTNNPSSSIKNLINKISELSEMSDGQMTQLDNAVQSVIQKYGLQSELNTLLKQLDLTDPKNVRKTIGKLKKIQKEQHSKTKQKLMDIEKKVGQIRREVAIARTLPVESKRSKRLANSSGNRGTSGHQTLGTTETSIASDWKSKSTDITKETIDSKINPKTTNPIIINPLTTQQSKTTTELILSNRTDESANVIDSVSDQYSDVYLGESADRVSVSFNQSHQQAQKQYTSAIKQNRIPFRYRQQIEDYLTALAQQNN